MAAPESAILSLAARVSLGRVEVGYALDGSLLDHGFCLLLRPWVRSTPSPPRPTLSDETGPTFRRASVVIVITILPPGYMRRQSIKKEALGDPVGRMWAAMSERQKDSLLST